jgi:flavorubredoxin
MRIFDVVMYTEYGTSYNSYVVKGGDKTALIDTAHHSFMRYYLDNIAEALNGTIPDYLVLNHNEPDHTGSVAALLKLYPNLKIIISQAGAIYIKNITNLNNLDIQTVKDGDELDLGGITLRFINAPFLHWPDSMFTYIPEEKLVFTCDFLGAHFCEPQWLDHRILYHDAYAAATRVYYDGIFAPFKPWVLKGLEKLEALDFEIAAPSHGPILTKGCELEKTIERYRRWSTIDARAQKSIPLFYCSAYGNTQLLATHIARGLLHALPEADVRCFDINKHKLTELAALMNGSDAFLLGSPTLNRDAVEPVWSLLASADAVNIAKRPVALFGSFGWSGEALPHLASRLTDLKVKLWEQQFKVTFVPTPEDLQAAEQFGADFASSLA